jgi:hypothetical protein
MSSSVTPTSWGEAVSHTDATGETRAKSVHPIAWSERDELESVQYPSTPVPLTNRTWSDEARLARAKGVDSQASELLPPGARDAELQAFLAVRVTVTCTAQCLPQ